ncbi:MAG: DUF3108 domain-containing protein [Rhodoferax sp.]|uniref:DUF3108 domain-containing protein n=1 Tax=Rhodoferax sp. TaxID=50421 RepID=UPI0026031AD3|nr:DUF3108 domain-containing protein [Rhodoferax sp.]MDD2881235.1 DUF3108 domain-containing protein [Rhodoferax sp.]
MAHAKTPLKAWLTLSLAVLLLHLALLQTMPLSLGHTAADRSALSFTTRTLTTEPVAHKVAMPTPVTTPVTTIKPKPKPVAKAAARPLPPAPVDAAPAMSTDGSAPSASADGPAVSEPALPEPASAPAPPTEPAPEPESAPAPPPPRDKAPSFSNNGLPGSVKLVYKVEANKFPYSLNGELVWAHAQGHYLASLSFGAFGQTRTQTSRGLIGADGLEPERFADKYRSEVAAHFNREQGKVTFSANTPQAALLSGAQDRLSVLIQLASLVASAPERFTAGTTLTLQTVGPRDADLWLFTVGNLEALTLPGGIVQGLKITRNPRQAYDQQMDIWLAPTLGYLPARIRITDANGDFIDQKWASSEAASMP